MVSGRFYPEDDFNYSEEVTVIENSREAMEKYGFNYGKFTFEATKEQIEALLNGKILAFEINLGEYAGFLRLKKEEEK